MSTIAPRFSERQFKHLAKQLGEHLAKQLAKHQFEPRRWERNVSDGTKTLNFPLRMNCYQSVSSALCLALVSCGLALAMRAAFTAVHLVEPAFVFFYGAVIVSGWFGGYRASLATTICADIFAKLAIFSPGGSWMLGGAQQITYLILFSSNGFLVSMLYVLICRTMAAERAAREGLKENAERFRSLADLMPQLVWESDGDGNVLYLNHQMQAVSDRILSVRDQNRDRDASASTDANHWLTVLHPDDAEVFRRRFDDAKRTGATFESECRFGMAGTYYWHIARATPQRDGSGRVVRWLGTCTNIHAQKVLQCQLEEQRERFVQLAENVRDQAFYVVDAASGKVSYLSPAYTQIWGWPAETFDFVAPVHVHPEDQELLANRHSRLERGENVSVEYRIIRPDGTERWILDRAFPLLAADGTLYRVTGIAEDVSKAKAARKVNQIITDELVASERKYRNLFLLNPQPMWIYDPLTLAFVEVNEAAILHYGYSREEFLKMTLLDIRPAKDAGKVVQIVQMARGEGILKHDGEYRHLKKSGDLVIVEISVSQFHFQGRDLRLVLVKDVTAQRHAEEKLLSAKFAAESANQAKTSFLANMSHEIRTPLGALLGFAELMLEPQSERDRKDCIETILRNGQRLGDVINDILDLSKVESSKLDIERLVFRPLDVIEEVTGLLHLQAEKKGIELYVLSQGELPERVYTDPTRLRQILLNIIGNAIKFTRQGFVSIRVNEEQGSAIGRHCLTISIRDTGPGIPPSHQARLFQPFSQADSSTTRLYGGSGLGLALSKSLAQALGGDVVLAESREGLGSTFIVTIDSGSDSERARPVADGKALPAPPPRAVREVDLDDLPHPPRVLLVEDSADNRVLVSRFVKAAGGRIECAENGVEGVRAALNCDYDLVLMDIQMPHMDGFQALKRLRDSGFKRPIVALTAHAMKGDREMCLQAGFSDYLVKPLHKGNLIEMISRHCQTDSVH